MRFRVGDRVRAIQNIYGFEINSLTGTIAVISEDSIGVAFDSYVSGAHSLDGRSRKGKAFPISLNDWRKHWDKMGGFKIVNSIYNPIRLSTGLKNTPFVVRDIHSRRVDAGLFSSNLNVWNDTTCVKFAIKEEI